MFLAHFSHTSYSELEELDTGKLAGMYFDAVALHKEMNS